MHYYLYEIKNKLNGKIYVGVHKTKSLDDGYMGSGTLIRNAIEKNGIEHFTKTILETFEDSDSMYAREKEVVNESFLQREDVYNLRCGGYGGFDHINKLGLNDRSGMVHSEKSRLLMSEKCKSAMTSERKIEMSDSMKIDNPMHNEDVVNKIVKALTGKPKSDEHKRKISEAIKLKHLQKKQNAAIV